MNPNVNDGIFCNTCFRKERISLNLEVDENKDKILSFIILYLQTLQKQIYFIKI